MSVTTLAPRSQPFRNHGCSNDICSGRCAGAPSGVLENGVSALQSTVVFRAREHRKCHPVLDAAGRVFPLKFRENVRASFGNDRAKSDQRSIANGLENIHWAAEACDCIGDSDHPVAPWRIPESTTLCGDAQLSGIFCERRQDDTRGARIVVSEAGIRRRSRQEPDGKRNTSIAHGMASGANRRVRLRVDDGDAMGERRFRSKGAMEVLSGKILPTIVH